MNSACFIAILQGDANFRHETGTWNILERIGPLHFATQHSLPVQRAYTFTMQDVACAPVYCHFFRSAAACKAMCLQVCAYMNSYSENTTPHANIDLEEIQKQKCSKLWKFYQD